MPGPNWEQRFAEYGITVQPMLWMDFYMRMKQYLTRRGFLNFVSEVFGGTWVFDHATTLVADGPTMAARFNGPLDSYYVGADPDVQYALDGLAAKLFNGGQSQPPLAWEDGTADVMVAVDTCFMAGDDPTVFYPPAA